MIFRPVRERPVQEVLDAVDRIIEATGFEEIGLLSLSSSDYGHIGELVEAIMAKHGDKKLSVGLPSLRIEFFSVELMGHLQKGRRRSGFTFAPEAATDRLRDVINKPIATEDLLRTRRGGLQPRLDQYQALFHDRPSHADAGRRGCHRRPGAAGASDRPKPRRRQSEGARRC